MPWGSLAWADDRLTNNVVLDQNVLVINTGDKLALFETGMSSVKRTDAMNGRRARSPAVHFDSKKEPHHLRRGRFPPKTGVDFSCRPQPESGDRGWGFHLRDGTQQSTHATARHVCGLISRRLTPLRRSGHSVSLVRRFSASLPSGHPSRTTFGPSPRRRHPGG